MNLPHMRREDMSRFLVKAHVPGNEEEELMERDGFYYKKPNWIEKFFRRGEALKDIFPSQLVIMYNPFTKGIKYEYN